MLRSAQTIQRNIHVSPRKLQLVAQTVRHLKPAQALEKLRFTNKRAADPLMKAIKTVLANARQRGLDEAGLIFRTVEINQGPVMKRSRVAGRGFISGYKKRTSQIKIVLSDEGNNIETLYGTKD